MKIYSKSNFIAGLIGLAVLVLYAVGVWEAHMGNWVIAIAFTANCLHAGLTKTRSDRMKHLAAHYDETARMLHGKYYALKRNLPLLVVAGFIVVGLVLKVLDIWIPEWFLGVWVVALLAAGVYGWVVLRSITEYIDEHFPQEEEPDA